MDNISLAELPTEQVVCIRKFIDQKKQQDEYLPYCANPILREDIFALLDQCCTVVYFPVDDQTNNGFHVRYPEGDIVYINTNQTKEKQIFTAAHELGHIWGLEDYIQEQLGVSLDHEQREQVVNRFAAELMMPDELCRTFVKRTVSGLPHDKHAMLVRDLLRLAAAIMNEFFVPYKAVVLRMHEISFIPQQTARLLLGETPDLSIKTIDLFLRALSKSEGYSRLFQKDCRKWIDGLKELLDKAQEQDLFPAGRIESLRTQFGLNVPEPDGGLSNSAPLTGEKEGQNGSTGSN